MPQRIFVEPRTDAPKPQSTEAKLDTLLKLVVTQREDTETMHQDLAEKLKHSYTVHAINNGHLVDTQRLVQEVQNKQILVLDAVGEIRKIMESVAELQQYTARSVAAVGERMTKLELLR